MSEQQDILPGGYTAQEPWSGPEHRPASRRADGTGRPRRHPVLLALLIVLVV